MVGSTSSKLLFNGDYGLGATRRKRAIVTIDTATNPTAAVAIGAGKAGVHINLADPAIEATAQKCPVGMYLQ